MAHPGRNYQQLAGNSCHCVHFKLHISVFLQNVFEQEVYRSVTYALTPQAVERIQKAGISLNGLESVFGKEFANAAKFSKVLANQKMLTDKDYNFIMASAEIDNLIVTAHGIEAIQNRWITENHKNSLRELQGQRFNHKWLLENALAEKSPLWRYRVNDPEYNADLKSSIDYICTLFRSDDG